MPVNIYKKDRDYESYRTKITFDKARINLVTRKGKVYSVGGRDVELFSIRVFAEALDRSNVTVRLLQKRKDIPPPLFKVAGKKEELRYYSAEQITNINRLLFKKYKGKKFLHDKAEYRRFLSEVCFVFYAKEIVVDEEGLISRDYQPPFPLKSA